MAQTAAVLNRAGRKTFWVAFALLVLLLLMLFGKAFQPGITVFSNDAPLGIISATSGRMPGGFSGVWLDLNWMGGRGISAAPDLTRLLVSATGPLIFSKIYPAFALLILGLCTWYFFRQLQFNALACTLGALAAVLNTNALSIACWGLPSWTLSRAMIFLALGLLVREERPKPLIRAALAGIAVGMAVCEGFDVGAICSVLVAAFVVFQIFAATPAAPAVATRATGRVALVAVCAGLMAAQTLSGLVGTQVQGIAGTAQDQKTREQQWDWATQWSLPKIETLRVVIPGLFGYRMDTPDGGNYWGSVGRQPGWEEQHQGLPRHSGSGEYAGVLVVLVAGWTVAQACRRKDSAFTDLERKHIWFWTIVAVIGLLLAFGRHAPFYRIVYALPYVSTIRNPIKFMHPFQIGLLVLFGYGLQALSRCYLENGRKTVEGMKDWWAAATKFERRTVFTFAAIAGLSLLGWLVYTRSRKELEQYLASVGFEAGGAQMIASFSIGEVGWYLLFLALSVGALLLIISGRFRGPRANAAGVVLGLILVTDLTRANQPWIQFYNYQDKYSSNPLIDLLREKPYEQRVTVLPFEIQNSPLSTLQQVYHVLWMQHTFPYFDIQALDVVQESRRPQEKLAFQTAVARNPVRYWQLTNTRYLLGLAGLQETLNQQLDPEKKRFRLHTAFTISQERADGPLNVVTNAAGPFALLEFTGALPRAKLYSSWQVVTNLEATLQMLVDPKFDPEQSVFVAQEIPKPSAATNANPGTVSITSYAPKHIVLKADAQTDAVLLLNDRYDPEWQVSVDGQPAPLLRANYIARGVFIPRGSHTVEFTFQPKITILYVSFAALAAGLVLLVILIASERRAPKD